MRHLHFILLIGIGILLQSCSDEGICTGVEVARVNAGFYVRSGDIDRDTVLNNVTFYAVIRPDSLIYDSALNVRGLVFPLSNDEVVAVDFVLKVDSLTDMVSVFKRSRLFMESYACGFTTHHELLDLDYQNNIIDTITISDPAINLFDDENIKIYIKPAVADIAL